MFSDFHFLSIKISFRNMSLNMLQNKYFVKKSDIAGAVYDTINEIF